MISLPAVQELPYGETVVGERAGEAAAGDR